MLNNLNLARCTFFDPGLPGAKFANAASLDLFAPERRRYESAVEAFAVEASPAILRETVKALRRHGIRVTKAQAREAAVDGLREALSALGYGEDEVQWHAARRGRRDRHLYIN